MSITCDGCNLELPVRGPRGGDTALKPFLPAEVAAPLAQTQLEPGHNTWTVTTDVMAGTVVLQRINDDGWRRIEGIGLELGLRTMLTYTIRPDDPLSSRLETHNVRRYRCGDWSTTCVTAVELTSNAETFLLKATLDPRQGSTVVKQQSWDLRIPRDHV